ncbi:hypothetical protein ACU8KH_00016 [Lachancea thermotolerans]
MNIWVGSLTNWKKKHVPREHDYKQCSKIATRGCPSSFLQEALMFPLYLTPETVSAYSTDSFVMLELDQQSCAYCLLNNLSDPPVGPLRGPRFTETKLESKFNALMLLGLKLAHSKPTILKINLLLLSEKKVETNYLHLSLFDAKVLHIDENRSNSMLLLSAELQFEIFALLIFLLKPL